MLKYAETQIKNAVQQSPFQQPSSKKTEGCEGHIKTKDQAVTQESFA